MSSIRPKIPHATLYELRRAAKEALQDQCRNRRVRSPASTQEVLPLVPTVSPVADDLQLDRDELQLHRVSANEPIPIAPRDELQLHRVSANEPIPIAPKEVGLLARLKAAFLKLKTKLEAKHTHVL